MSASETI